MSKWDRYYQDAEHTGTPPPWESDQPFHLLPALVSELFGSSRGKAIELGCGASATAIWLASQGFDVTAVDSSRYAIERARRLPTSEKVSWVQADIFDDFFEPGSFQLVFDLQCFHVVREIDERKAAEVIARLLGTSGIAVVVVGAAIDEIDEDQIKHPGPPRLTKDFVSPLLLEGLELISLNLSQFDSTPAYGSAPPPCYVAVLKKK
jgi:SAM-dependent methyltransferase